MKSSAPWSVKGIERSARETAKEAARREGMTVGEWLNQVIYAAGDPETSNGEIEGLKISDLVTAIEHLNKRALAAENRTAEAIDDLARNFGGVVERVQRLERVKPGAAGVDLEERLQRLEAKSGDRERIEALKALEKAVSQVALQFDAAQKSSMARLDSTEQQLQELASRLDNAGALGEPADESGAIAHLRDTIDGLAARIARAERIAAEATNLKAGASESADAEFVERTGERLRILGDEIKRGGDQIRALESSIKKLGDQIDAAERRSSEGVQKVSETIAELRANFAQEADDGGAAPRDEIEAAVAAASERAEGRIDELQRSFEALAARIEASQVAPPPTESENEVDTEVDLDALEDPLAAFVLDEDRTAPVEEGTARETQIVKADGASEALDEGDAFSFDLEDDETEAAQAPAEGDGEEDVKDDLAASLLGEVESAFAGRSATPLKTATDDESTSDERDNTVETPMPGEDDGIDAILAELDNLTPDDEADDTRPDAVSAPNAGSAATTGEEPPKAQSAAAMLRAARQAAREAAAAAADSPKPIKRRNLTPKQRAIIAAKIRRKRLAAQGLDPEVATATKPAVRTIPEPESDAPDAEETAAATPGFFKKAAAAISALKARLPGRGAETDDDDDEQAESRTGADDNIEARKFDDVAEADDEQERDTNPNITAAARAALARAKPVTIALGVAIVLAAAALFFLIKDLVFGGAPSAPVQRPAAVTTTAPETADVAPSGSTQTAIVPPPPQTPAEQPRTLYLESVAKLKNATNDADTREALQGLEKAAALGHPPAQLQLGELYKLGQGVDQDLTQARLWYERAANGGNILAMHRVGVMAARGQGGPTDQDSAIDWFKMASNLGLVDSQYNLGAIYHPAGDGAANPVQDVGESYYWYSLAAKNGDEQAGALAAALESNLSADQRSAVKARVEAWAAGTPDPDANEIAPAT